MCRTLSLNDVSEPETIKTVAVKGLSTLFINHIYAAYSVYSMIPFQFLS